MGLSKDIVGVTGGISVPLYLLAKIGLTGRDQFVKLSFLLMACAHWWQSTAEYIEASGAQKIREEEQERRLAVVMDLVFTDRYDTANRKRSRLSRFEYDLQRKNNKKMKECTHKPVHKSTAECNSSPPLSTTTPAS
jgi:hypothetical protein